MAESAQVPPPEVNLLVFTFPPRAGLPLRLRISQALDCVLDDAQIDGWSLVGPTFTVGQILDPSFRLPGDHQLAGWLDDNALWQVPQWHASVGIPPILAETLRGWIEGAFGTIVYTTAHVASIVSVSPSAAAVAPSGWCRCGHDAAQHQLRCAVVFSNGLGCGCLTFRTRLPPA